MRVPFIGKTDSKKQEKPKNVKDTVRHLSQMVDQKQREVEEKLARMTARAKAVGC